MTGLHWAALNGNAEIVRLLIDAGAALEAATRLGAHTPLRVAALEGQGEVVAILADAGGRRATATTGTGATPIHFAAASGDVRAWHREGRVLWAFWSGSELACACW